MLVRQSLGCCKVIAS